MIKVQGISKSYGAIEALKGVSFEVPAGQILGFLGPNGAGKSTMMRILTCFISPSGGQASVAGHDVIEESLAVRRSIGYLPESCPLYEDMTVYEYLAYVAEARGIPKELQLERLREAVETCGLTQRVDQIIGTLSKGYRQRVGLAQALIHQPDVLILDEPTSGLDPNQIVEIREVIKRIGAQKTIILSTHILSEVQATCDRVLIINEGQIVADGSPEELARRMGADAIHVELAAGPKLEDARRALGGLPGVASVAARSTETPGTLALRLELKPKEDPRAKIFAAVVEQGWTLLELHRAERNLEDVFRQLTRGN